MKPYTKQKDALEEVGLELGASGKPTLSDMVEEIDQKVQAMNGMIKSAKKLQFAAEAELKKDCSRAVSGVCFHNPFC